MTDIDTLIRDLEAATEGSREHDCSIHTLVTSEKTCKSTGGADYPLAEGKKGGWMKEVPRYTTSLDAALTLVPEGWRKEILDWTNEGSPTDNGGVILEHNEPRILIPENGYIWARTPALALCIASLKARAS